MESLLSFPLPQSYRDFVKRFGFGGPENNPYKGITENDPLKEVSESANYQTMFLKREWGLPDHYLVVHYDYDLHLATCIDLSSNNGRVVLIEYRKSNPEISVLGRDFKDVFIRHMKDLIAVNSEG